MKKIFTSIVFVSVSFLAIGQTELVDKADLEVEDGNFKTAIGIFQSALKTTIYDSAKSMINYKLGRCYNYLLDYTMAAKYYEKAYDLEKEDTWILYEVATTLKRDGQYKDANKYFKEYKKKSEDKEDKEKAEMHLKSYEITKDWINNPSPYSIKLNRELSSPFYDFSPCFINNQNSSMIFTTSRQYQDSVFKVGNSFNFFYSNKEGGKWSTPLPLDTAKNKKANDGGTITIDNKRKVAFFTLCHRSPGKFDCGIYYSFMKGDLMGEPIRLNIPNTNESTILGHPCFSNEFDLLFFAAKLPGGYGGKDIWVTKYNRENDSWGNPQNLGPEINTSENELFPVITSDGTLYFSSEGHINLGGLDIFKASKTGEMTWGNVDNLKYPINSSGDDFGIIFNNSSNSGYFCSDRKGGLGRDDIYEFSYKNEMSNKQSQGKQIQNKQAQDKQTQDKQTQDKQTQDKQTIEDQDNLLALSHLFNKEACPIVVDSLVLKNTKVYPNPNNGEFTLEFYSNIATNLTIRIYSNLGQIVSLEKIETSTGIFTKHFDLQNEKSGVYYLQILRNCESIYSEKMIKK